MKSFKKRYVVLIILAVFLVIVFAVAFAHRDLIQAARSGLTMDAETILANQEEKDKELEASLGIEGMVTEEMIEEAQEEIDHLVNGMAEDVVEQAESVKAAAEQAAAQANTAAAEDIVAKYTAKLYGVRGSFQGRLNGLMASAEAEFMSLPPEQRTSAAKRSIIYSKIGQGEAMEAECDAIVESILGQMQAELAAAGQSTAPVSQLRSQYQNAKVSQKAAYLAMARGA